MTPQELAEQFGLQGSLPHLEEALTHPSWSNEQKAAQRFDNQRLEFLGDAVLGLCVGELLMDAISRVLARASSRWCVRSSSTPPPWRLGPQRDLGAALRVGRGAEAAGERDREACWPMRSKQ